MQPVILDNNIVGYTLFFHHSFSYIAGHLPLHPDSVQPENLIAAILPWTLSPEQLMNRIDDKPRSLPLAFPPAMEEKKWLQSLKTKPRYHHALRTLCFPQDLYEYLSQRPGTPYCIWAEVNPVSKKMTMEARLLEDILKQTKSRKVPEGSSCRIVFVHFGALKTLHQLPGLVSRRSQQHEVSFYTFGTQEGTPPRAWIVEEIYPCGSHPKPCTIRFFCS